MKKTSFLFLLAFVAMGSMLFIGGVQQAQATCPAGTSPCDPATLCSKFTTVSVPANATAVTTVCSQYLCATTQCNDKEITTGFTCNSGYVLSADGTSCVQNASARITVAPSLVGVGESATVLWSCGGAFDSCRPPLAGASPQTVSYPSVGSHTYTVEALDAKQNVLASDSATLTVTAPSTSYNCNASYQCVSVSGTGGTYPTQSSCQTACVAPATHHYACSGSSCVIDASGPYTTSNCNNACSVSPSPTFTIAPPSATIQVGGTQQYTGYYDPDGAGPQPTQTIAATSVAWSSSNTSAATISSSGLATGATAGSVTIRGTYSGITAWATLNVQSASSPDFAISVSPITQNVNQGSSVAYGVTISPLNGFTGTVSLGSSNLTTGLSGTFSPTSVSGGSGTSQFTLSASASAALGASNFTITGTSGVLSHSVQPTVNVTAGSPPPPTVSDTVPVDVYFCTSPSDPTPGCSAGGPGQCTITASPQNILTGMSSMLTWGCTGISSTTPCSVSGDNGAGTIWNSLSGWSGSSVTQTVRPYSTTNYTIQCTGVNPSSAQTRVNVGFFPLLREIIPRW